MWDKLLMKCISTPFAWSCPALERHSSHLCFLIYKGMACIPFPLFHLNLHAAFGDLHRFCEDGQPFATRENKQPPPSPRCTPLSTSMAPDNPSRPSGLHFPAATGLMALLCIVKPETIASPSVYLTNYLSIHTQSCEICNPRNHFCTSPGQDWQMVTLLTGPPPPSNTWCQHGLCQLLKCLQRFFHQNPFSVRRKMLSDTNNS